MNGDRWRLWEFWQVCASAGCVHQYRFCVLFPLFRSHTHIAQSVPPNLTLCFPKMLPFPVSFHVVLPSLFLLAHHPPSIPQSRHIKCMEGPFEYEDITTHFRTAFHTLKSGDLVAVQNFSLLESMSAVQLMDKKLDSGMSLMGCQTLPARLETGVLRPSSDLSGPELISLADELLRRTAMWLEGESLVNTILGCLYSHEPALYAQTPVLKAVFECLFHVIDVAGGLIAKASCLRDDDVAFSYCKVDHETRGVSEIVGSCKAADRWAAQNCEALSTRIAIFRGIMEVAENLKKPDCAGFGELERCIAMIEPALQSVGKDHTDANTQAFFDDVYALRYVNNFPAHKIPISVNYTFTSSLSRLSKFLLSLRHFHTLQQAKDVDELSAGIIALPSWDVLSRTALNFQLLSATDPPVVLNTRPLMDLIHTSMAKAGLDVRSVANTETFKSFSTRVELVLKEILKMRLKNPTRQRRSLWKHFPDLTILLSESEYAEPPQAKPAKKNRGPVLFNWMFKRLTNHMIEFLQQGISLELYNPSELGMVMFYQDYLLGLHISALQNINEHLSGQKKSRKPKVDPTEVTLHQALQLLCRGVVRVFVILMKHKALPITISEEQQQILFAKRFRYFDYIQIPSKLEYSSYQAVASMPDGSDERYHQACQECFDTAKSLLSSLPQAPAGLVRVCIANSFAVTIGSKAGWRVKAEFVYKENPHFPTVKVTPIK